MSKTPSSAVTPPTRSRVVVLCVDVVNDLEFEGGETLLPHAVRMAKKVAPLLERARREGVAVVFANDNFGHWRSDFRALVRHVIEDGVRGAPIMEHLHPAPSDFFILKPMHSAFFSTALETLLQALGARVLVLVGIAGDNCVLFTAHDAYMRGYRLIVPSDGVASEDPRSNRWALEHMKRFLKVDARAAARVDFRALLRERNAKARDATTVSRRGVSG